jgi:phosphatidylglycerophosphate synthase
MGFISKEGLKALDDYHYVSGGYTALDKLMNPFWEWCDTLIPRRVAPNLITFVGFILMTGSYLIMLWYDQTFQKALPAWVYVVVAVCQFLYQTLDAVDGKHARNTKSSSPLGQLFDHGCDSFSVTFLLLSTAQTVRLGFSIEALFFFNLIQWVFFCSNWAEYHTGVLRTGLSNFGVTEGELLILGAIFLTGVITPGFFITNFSDVFTHLGIFNAKTPEALTKFFAFDLKDLILRPIYLGVSLAIIFMAYSVIKNNAKDKLQAASQFLPLVFTMASSCLWFTLPVFKEHAALIFLILGLVYSLNTSRVIVCSLTKMASPIVQTEYIVTILGYLLVRLYDPSNIEFSNYVLIGLAVYVTISACLWARGCVNQISAYLGIYCFSLDKRERVKAQ